MHLLIYILHNNSSSPLRQGRCVYERDRLLMIFPKVPRIEVENDPTLFNSAVNAQDSYVEIPYTGIH